MTACHFYVFIYFPSLWDEDQRNNTEGIARSKMFPIPKIMLLVSHGIRVNMIYIATIAVYSYIRIAMCLHFIRLQVYKVNNDASIICMHVGIYNAVEVGDLGGIFT